MIDDTERIARAERILRGEPGEGRGRPPPVADDPSWSTERRALEAEIRRHESCLPDGHHDLEQVAFPGGGRGTRLAFRKLFEPSKPSTAAAPIITKALASPAPTPTPQRRIAIGSRQTVLELAAEEKLSAAEADEVFDRLKSLQEVPLEVALGVLATAFLLVRNASKDRGLDVEILASFEQRLASLESSKSARRTMSFRAAFDIGEEYGPGDVVQAKSALWVAMTTVLPGQSPGDGSPVWRKISGESR